MNIRQHHYNMRFLILFALVAVAAASHHSRLTRQQLRERSTKEQWHPSTEQKLWTPETEQKWWYPQTEQKWYTPETEQKWWYPQTEQKWWTPKTEQKWYPESEQQWYPRTEQQWYPRTEQEWYPRTEQQWYQKTEQPQWYPRSWNPYVEYRQQLPVQKYEREMPYQYQEQMYQYQKPSVVPILPYIQKQFVEHQKTALQTLIRELGYQNVEIIFNFLIKHPLRLTPQQYADLVRNVEQYGYSRVQELLNHFAGERFYWQHKSGMENLIEFDQFINIYELLGNLRENYRWFFEQNPEMYQQSVEEQWPKYWWNQEWQTDSWNREWPMSWWNREQVTPYMQEEYQYPMVY